MVKHSSALPCRFQVREQRLTCVIVLEKVAARKEVNVVLLLPQLAAAVVKPEVCAVVDPGIDVGFDDPKETHGNYAEKSNVTRRALWSVCCLSRVPLNTTFAGFPITTEYGGTSVTTTLLTPTIAPSPTVTPFKMKAFCPIQADRQIETFDLLCWRKIRSACGRIARMRVGVHELGARRDIYVVFNNDFLVDYKSDMVADIDAIADAENRLIENGSTEDIDNSEEINVIADFDLHVSDDIGHSIQADVLAGLSASGQKQRLPINPADQT